jgi:hypothetical protein
MSTMLRLAGVLGLASASSCLSPTLPLPPPEAPTLEAGSDADHVKLVVPGDLAVSGARADDCGAWDALVYAHSQDELDITQEFGETRSTPEVVQVP